ncbi:MAG: GIY-YIG nuclease family protein [bacterium]
MFYSYIIYSKTLDKYYIGSTENIEDRLARHKRGSSKFTSRAKDWVLVYSEKYDTKSEAIKREYEIKRQKSRKYIESLIKK